MKVLTQCDNKGPFIPYEFLLAIFWFIMTIYKLYADIRLPPNKLIYALYNTVPFFRLNIKPTSKAKCITYHLKGLLKINREEAFNIMLMMAAVLSSILIHLILDNFPQVSHWNLIFWKACVQMGISLPFMLQKRRNISLSFGQKIAPKLSVRKTMLDPFLTDT